MPKPARLQCPPKSQLLELFEDALTHLIRKSTGKFAGNICPSTGYIRVRVNNRTYQCHRLLWVMRNGEIPLGMDVDHVDRNPLNNAPTNLRLCSHSQNMKNRKLHKNNSSGVAGVYLSNSGKWIAQVRSNGRKYKRTFSSKEDAIEYSKELRAKLHKEFSA
jgi:hypothetical protein